MDKKKNCGCSDKEEKKVYIGEAINIADDNKVNKKLVKERTETQNLNPRNNDIDN